MLLDLLAVVVLLAFLAFGAARGAVTSGAGVVTLIVGYTIGFVSASLFGSPLAAALQLPSIVGPPLAGSLGFFAAFLVCGGVSSVLKGWDRERLGDLPRGGGDRALGAAFGLVRGGLVVVLLAWMAIWVDAARDLSGGESFASAPDTKESTVAAATSVVIEAAVETALSDAGAGAKVAARMAARPSATLESIQALLDDSRIKAVSNDKMFWTYVQNGAIDSALNRASFYRVVNDEQLRTQLSELGLIEPEAVEDPKVFRESVGRSLADIGPRIKGLANDQELQDLAKDPQVIAMIEEGNTVGLVGHPGVQRLVSRLSEGL